MLLAWSANLGDLALAGQRSDRSGMHLSHPPHRGDLVPRPNYRQAKKHKELSRKARQLEKQQRRTARPNGSEKIATPLEDPPVAPTDPTSSHGT